MNGVLSWFSTGSLTSRESRESIGSRESARNSSFSSSDKIRSIKNDLLSPRDRIETFLYLAFKNGNQLQILQFILRKEELKIVFLSFLKKMIPPRGETGEQHLVIQLNILAENIVNLKNEDLSPRRSNGEVVICAKNAIAYIEPFVKHSTFKTWRNKFKPRAEGIKINKIMPAPSFAHDNTQCVWPTQQPLYEVITNSWIVHFMQSVQDFPLNIAILSTPYENCDTYKYSFVNGAFERELKCLKSNLLGQDFNCLFHDQREALQLKSFLDNGLLQITSLSAGNVNHIPEVLVNIDGLLNLFSITVKYLVVDLNIEASESSVSLIITIWINCDPRITAFGDDNFLKQLLLTLPDRLSYSNIELV
jgi:hypothetical protein